MPARRSFLRTAALIAALTPCTALAQAQPQGAAANPNAGMLTPTTTNAAAVSELRASLDRYNLWNASSAADHAKRALELEPTFGLARTVHTLVVGGPTAAAEYSRAATEASSASAGEALLALSSREVNAGRAPIGRRLSQTAAELMPNDRQVATWRAIQLPDTQRVNAFRDVANRFPEYPGAKVWLAFYLTPAGLDSIVKANADEAMRAAMGAVRLAPNESGTHAAVAHVLTYNGRYAEAKQHLAAATRLSPASEYSYELLAQIAAVEGNMTAMRAALDTAAATTPSFGARIAYRRSRALTFLADGNSQQAQAELATIAREAEAVGSRPQAALTHLFMASVAGGARDTAGVEAHLAAARALDVAPGTLVDYEVSTYSLSGQAAKARSALQRYIELGGPQPNLTPQVNATRTTNVHRMTGLVLLAEKKPSEAITELRQAGDNPYAALGIVESYRLQKNTKQADAELKAFFAKGNFSFVSSAVPIMRYRAKR